MAHHVTAARLSVLQRAAYQQYFDTHLANDALPTFREWCKTHSEVHPQFLTHDNLTRAPSHAVCEISERRQLPAVLKTLGKLAPWLFDMDRTRYSRWVSVHIRDMTRLKDTHPSVYRQFAQGHFTVQKTGHTFSSMALDQNHEQLDEGDGGAVGFTENPVALLRWMVAGPEIARLVNEFDEHNWQLCWQRL